MSPMTQADVLYALLWVSLAGSCLLIPIAFILIGKETTQAEYQKAAGINGTTKLQGVTNIVTYAMRVLVGVTFLLISTLLLTDVNPLFRQWVNRLLFAILPSGYFVVCVWNMFVKRQQLHIEIAEENDRKLARVARAAESERLRHVALVAEAKSSREMATEAIESLATVAAKARAEQGQGVTRPLAPVVPEHNSPVTPEQQSTADQQTLRAKLVAAKLDLDLPPRDAQPSVDPPAETLLTPAILSGVLEQSLDEMAVAASETVTAARKTVTAAEQTVDALHQEQEKREDAS